MTRGTLTVRVRGVPFPIEFADWTHDRLYHTVEFQGGDSQEILAFIGAIGSPIPGGSRTLTEVDTNIPRSGDTGLQEGWEMLIYSIQIEIVREMARNNDQQAFSLQDISGNPATTAVQLSRPAHAGGYDPSIVNGGVLFDFMRKTYHKFTVNQKVQSEGPVEEYPQGSGIYVFGTTSDIEIAGNGPPSPRDQSAFVLPIWLRPQIAYVARLKPQAALGIGGSTIGPSPFPGGTVQGYQNWTNSDDFTNLGFDVRETLEGLLKRPVVGVLPWIAPWLIGAVSLFS
jgi:hypothetical protein